MCLESYLYATNHVERPRSNVVSYGRAQVIECDPRDAPRDPRDSQFVFLFSRASDERCYKKFEKVGPFECDELGYVVWLLEKQKDPPPGRVVNARN